MLEDTNGAAVREAGAGRVLVAGKLTFVERHNCCLARVVAPAIVPGRERNTHLGRPDVEYPGVAKICWRAGSRIETFGDAVVRAE